MHEHKPINHDHEIICSECGVVIAAVIEFPTVPTNPYFYQELQALTNITTQQYKQVWKTKDKFYQEQCIKVYNRLHTIIDKEYLPEQYANEAMRIILARHKGLWSYKWQLITLIQVLQNTNDIRMRNHVRHIKELLKYANGT